MKKSQKLAVVQKHYKHAISTIDLFNRIIEYIEDDLDAETNKVMLADSWCSDDVNSIQYPVRASEFLGPFKLGGLDGYPFVGASGMSAFAGHVPTDGLALVMFGPHIGVSLDGTLGSIHRIGQEEKTGCCGAASLGLSKLLKNELVAGQISEMDYQMNVLEQIMLRQYSRIAKSDLPVKEATDVIYEAIEKRILELISLTKFKCKYLMLVGVVLINSDPQIGSFSQPRYAKLIDLETNEERELISLFE